KKTMESTKSYISSPEAPQRLSNCGGCGWLLFLISITRSSPTKGLLHGLNEACHLREIVLTTEPEATYAQERARIQKSSSKTNKLNKTKQNKTNKRQFKPSNFEFGMSIWCHWFSRLSSSIPFMRSYLNMLINSRNCFLSYNLFVSISPTLTANSRGLSEGTRNCKSLILLVPNLK
ncbi:calponin y domain-containing protein, partial [Pyrus ussuriensis x Pyrus communis]